MSLDSFDHLLAVREARLPHLNYLTDQMGRFDLFADAAYVAGAHETLRLRYTAGTFGVDDGGVIKLSWRVTSDMAKPQFDDPSAANFSTVTVNGQARAQCRVDRENIRPWTHTLHIRIHSGCLRAGDDIDIVLGETRQGSPGLRLQTHTEKAFRFKGYVDPFATYEFNEIPSDMRFAIVPGETTAWRVIGPTLIAQGDRMRLGVVGEDRWGNAAPCSRRDLVLELKTRDGETLGAVEVDADQTVHQTCDFRSDTTGDFFAQVRSAAGEVLGRSNPIRIEDDPRYKHYWGDLHFQTMETTGANSVEDGFAFARDMAMLDIACHQANCFQVTDAVWRQINAATQAFNTDRFLAIPGYEWSGNTGVGGDRNVLYRREDRPIFRSSRALTTREADNMPDAHTATDLFQALRGEDAVALAHFGGRWSDVTAHHDPVVQRSVEIHATWGTSEWLLHDAFKAGCRVGVVAHSDDHKGRPGATKPGGSGNFTAVGGITAYLMPQLTRDALFDALRKRRHYGTTGARIFLDVRARFDRPVKVFDDDPLSGVHDHVVARHAMMGDIVAPGDATMTLTALVRGAAPVERIDLLRGGDIIRTERSWAPGEAGRRLRVLCEGARFRGRNGVMHWLGRAKVDGATIVDAQPVNFLTPASTLSLGECEGGQAVRWSCTTRGNRIGFDLLLDRFAGTLEVATDQRTFRLPLADIGDDDVMFETDGLDARIRVFRLPDTALPMEMTIEHDVSYAGPDDAPIYVRATQADGHQAWSSPIYLITP